MSIAATASATNQLSEDEAIAIASDFRRDAESTFEAAAEGRFEDVASTMDAPVISPDLEVWAVTFSGQYDIGCDYSECPKPGTETVVIDASTGEFVVSAAYSPEE
jgi:hypothetical protein